MTAKHFTLEWGRTGDIHSGYAFYPHGNPQCPVVNFFVVFSFFFFCGRGLAWGE